MKYLQIVNAALLALGAVMALVLAVVSLLYGAHLEEAPRLRADLPRLLELTGWFLLLAAASGATFFGHRRRWPGRWLLQGTPLVALAAVILFFVRLRG